MVHRDAKETVLDTKKFVKQYDNDMESIQKKLIDLHRDKAVDYLAGHMKASLEVHYLKFKTTSQYDAIYKKAPKMAKPKIEDIKRYELDEQTRVKAQQHYAFQIEKKGWDTKDR